VTTKQSTTWVIAGAGLAIGIALAVWALSVPSGGGAADPGPMAEAPSEPPPPPAAAPQTEPVPGAQPPAAPAAKPVEPSAVAPSAPPIAEADLFAEPMPDFMTDLHARVLDKKWLGAPDQKKLYQYGQEHKDDARPQLIMAWDAMNREWYGMAASLYRIAYKADPRSKGDPSMLRDLISVAGRYDRMEFDESAGVIKSAYGEDALPYVNAELDKANDANDTARATRLSRLRDQLSAP
jgi:hypothetical protein